ncbi:MAG: lipid A deacylase LpxR family protein [Alphaproteobacteria bacterium]
MKIQLCLTSLLTCFVAGLPAFAQAPVDDAGRGTWSFTVENDIIAGTDRDYTNGALVSYVGPSNDLPLAGRIVRDNLDWLTTAQKWHMTYGVGQNMYTPQDITASSPDPTDRPYAGFLYGSIGIAADRRDSEGEARQLDVLALDVGIVGNGSLAEETQKLVHKVINDQRPRGWDEQLKTEVAFRLLYERNWRASQKWDLPVLPIEGDITPHVGVALGTAETYGAIGASVRLGEDLGDDYGPPRVRPALASPGFFSNVDGFSWYVFAGVQGRYVARDLFIEGNTYRDSAGTELQHFQMDVQAGIAIQLGRTKIAFTHVARSPQHRKQDRWNRFGSINLRTRF